MRQTSAGSTTKVCSKPLLMRRVVCCLLLMPFIFNGDAQTVRVASPPEAAGMELFGARCAERNV